MNYQIKHYHNLQQNYAKKIWLIAYLRHWLTSITDFDSMTYEANPTNLVDLCQRSLQAGNFHDYDKESNLEHHDFLYHIVKDIFGNSINFLLTSLNTKIVREHEIMPLVNAREFDTLCMQWVARKSGRNLKEKLSLDNKVLAVKRRQNYDTLENRLLKALLTELQYLFDEKQNAFALGKEDNGELEFLERIETWLLSDDAYQIGRWQNLPPNNTLLQHKYYKKVWYVWQFLQRIDEILENDNENYVKNTFLTLHYQLIARLMQYDEVRIPQSPVTINYEDFSIISAVNSTCVKGYLINDDQNQGFFILTVHESYYQVTMFNNENKILFDIICRFNPKDNNDSFVLEFAIKGGDWKNAPFLTINNLLNEIMSAFKHWLSDIAENVTHITTDQAIINLANTNISVFNGRKYHHLPQRLLAQFWDNEKEKIYAGHANALYVSDDVKTYSLTHALESNKEIQSDIIPTIIGNLSDAIDCKRIICITPDKFDDFSSQVLKQSLNSRFSSATVLPQSVATAFALLEQNIPIQANSSFVAISVDNHSITFTLLKASEDEVLNESGYPHVVWERYPADTQNFANNFEDYLIKSTEPAFANLIATNFSPVEVQDTNLTLITTKDYQHFEELVIDEHEIRIEQTAFDKIYQTLENFVNEYKDIKFLVTSETQHILPKKYSNRLAIVDNLERGANFLSQQQEKLGELGNRLWRDHLPYMGIRVRTPTGYGRFDLVKDITVTPRRGQRIEIPVTDEFTLPKNQSSYQFPLYLGNKDKANAYQATLSSSSFPFSQDTDCQVRLYYTYGAEQPYELYFIPNGKNERIKAKWEDFDDSNIVYPVPIYPEPATLEELQNFITKSGEVINLLDKATGIYQDIINDLSTKSRTKGTVKQIPSNKPFMFLSNTNGEQILLHKNNLVDEDMFDMLDIDDRLYFEEIKTSKGLSAKGASTDTDYPHEFYLRNFQEFNARRLNWNKFVLLNILNNAQKFDTDSTLLLVNVSCQAVDSIVDVFSKVSNYNYKNIKDYLYFILYSHYPYINTDFLTSVLKDLDRKKFNINLAYLLADLNQSWQQQIFDKLLVLIDNNPKAELFELFGIAFWRHTDLIYHTPDEKVLEILQAIIKVIESENNNVSNPKFYRLSRYWQLVLALLRLRIRPSIKHILSPTHELIDKLISLLEKTESLLKRPEHRNKKFRTYIEFTLDKPQDEPSSDFFYALRLYLTGDDGANSIRIKVNQEE